MLNFVISELSIEIGVFEARVIAIFGNTVYVFAASLVGYMETACMFAKMLNAILFARQNPIYAVVYVLICFCKF